MRLRKYSNNWKDLQSAELWLLLDAPLAFQSKAKLVKLGLSLPSINHLLQHFKFLPFLNNSVGSGLSANLWKDSMLYVLVSALMNFSLFLCCMGLEIKQV